MAWIFSSDSESDSESESEKELEEKKSQFYQYVQSESLLQKAVDAKDIPKMKNYIKSASDLTTKEFQRALYESIKANFVEGVQILLQAGIDPDVYFNGLTPLMVASKIGHFNCVKELLVNRNIGMAFRSSLKVANRNLLSHIHYKKTALYYAVEYEHLNCVKLLVQHGALVSVDILKAAFATDIVEYCQELFKSPITTFDSEFCHKAIISGGVLEQEIAYFLVEKCEFTEVHRKQLFGEFAGVKYNRWKYMLEHQWKPKDMSELFGNLDELAESSENYAVSLQDIIRLVMDNDPESEIDVNAEFFCEIFVYTEIWLYPFVCTEHDLDLLRKFIEKYQLDQDDKFVISENSLNVPYEYMRSENVKFLMSYNINPIIEENRVIVRVSTTQEFKRALYVSRAFHEQFFIILEADELDWPDILQDLVNVTIIGNKTTLTSTVQIKGKIIRIKGCTFPHGLQCELYHLFMEECEVNNFSCKINNMTNQPNELNGQMIIHNSRIYNNGLQIYTDGNNTSVELIDTAFERCPVGVSCNVNRLIIYTRGLTFKENIVDIDIHNTAADEEENEELKEKEIELAKKIQKLQSVKEGIASKKLEIERTENKTIKLEKQLTKQEKLKNELEGKIEVLETEIGSSSESAFYIANIIGLKVNSSKKRTSNPKDGELVVIHDTIGKCINDNGWYKIKASDKGVRSDKVFRTGNIYPDYFGYSFSRPNSEFNEVFKQPPTRMYPFLSEIVFKLNLLKTKWDFTNVIHTTGIFYDLLSCFNDCENILSPLEFHTYIVPRGYCIIDLLLNNMIQSKYYDALLRYLFQLRAQVSENTIAYTLENVNTTPYILKMCVENGAKISIIDISNALYTEVEKKNIKVLVELASVDASEMIKVLIYYKTDYPEIFQNFLEKIKEQTWEDTGVIGYVIVQRDNIEEDFQYEEYIPDLIDAGADINAFFNEKDEKPRTPLYLCATEWGNIYAFEQILEIADTSGQIEDVLRYVGNTHGQTTPEKILCAGLLMDIVEEMPFQRYLNNPLPVNSEDFFGWLTGNQNVIDILFRRCRFNGHIQSVKEPHLNPNLVPLCNMVNINQLENAGASPWWPKRFSYEESGTQRKRKWQEHIMEQVKQSEPLVMEVLHWHSMALQYLPYNMQNDPKHCLEAVKQDGMALHWCSINRKMDIEVVTEAVKQNWRAFEFLPEHLEHDGHVLPLPAQDYGPWIIWMKDNLFVEGAVHEGKWTQFMTKFPAAAALAMYRKYDSQERKKASVNEALKSFKQKRVDDLYKHRIIQI
tara:strand:- start:614 stop:4432 length:3819 start_codon:yes stop_codon:yes gene_type:complete